MLTDRWGNKVATDRPATIAALDRFTNSFLSYGTDFAVIFAAADDDPACPAVQTHAAILGLFMENAEGRDLARRYLDRARQALGGATKREILLFEATDAWRRGDMITATARHEKLAAEYPGDIFSIKLGQTHYFNLGNDEGMLRLGKAALAAHPDCAHALGMMAFALEQNHRLSEAEAHARQAVALNPGEAWAHHAVAHVLETRGQVGEGIAWMQENAGYWERCNSFMYTHNWWHLGLFLLDAGQADAVLKLFDTHIWGVDKSYSQDQAGAVSLLWRLELRGIDTGRRWQDVAEHIGKRDLVHDLPFLDLHYLKALLRTNDDVAAAGFIAGMETQHDDPPWREVCIPFARAMQRRRRDPAGAADTMNAVIGDFQAIGGSHAQRDLFVQEWIDCALAANRPDMVIATLRERAETRPAVPWGWRLLARAQRLDGQDRAARASEEKAARAADALKESLTEKT